MTNKHPRLRSHTRKRKSGKVVTYYVYDRRPEGEKDIQLGTDYQEALKQWDEIHNRKPRIAGTLEEAFTAWEKDVLPTKMGETLIGYTKHLKKIRPVFGPATWDEVTFPVLKGYLKQRTAKTQANRELALLSIVWRWAIGEGITSFPWPAAGMEKSKWKNKENARAFEVTDALFSAVYAEGDQVLQDCMDIATATAIRLTDVKNVPLPPAMLLRVKTNKTGKTVEFDAAESPVLAAIIERRRTYKATHLKLLSTPTGRQVSLRMLRDRWDEAREEAAAKAREEGNEELAALIEKMFLRDMRKRAANLSDDLDAASKLLDHSSKKTTETHYWQKAKKLTPVR